VVGRPEGDNPVSGPLDAQLAVPWTAVEAVGLLGVFLLLPVVLGSIVGNADTNLAAFSGIAIVDGVVAVGGAMLLVRGRRTDSTTRLLGLVRPNWRSLRRSVTPCVAGILANLAVLFAMGVVLHTVGVAPEDVPRQPVVDLIVGDRSALGRIFAAAAVLIAAPIAEEVIFRFALYLPLRASVGVVPAALLVSFAFAAVHLFGWGFPQLLVLSLTLVALFEYSGTLWAPIAAHGLYNAVQLLFILLRPA
jgi:membrane protease YdiL (CAAX protease family)